MIAKCNCKADSRGNTSGANYQDEVYGVGMRIHNLNKKGKVCVVCGKDSSEEVIKPVDETKTDVQIKEEAKVSAKNKKQAELNAKEKSREKKTKGKTLSLKAPTKAEKKKK